MLPTVHITVYVYYLFDKGFLIHLCNRWHSHHKQMKTLNRWKMYSLLHSLLHTRQTPTWGSGSAGSAGEQTGRNRVISPDLHPCIYTARNKHWQLEFWLFL